MSPIPRSIHDLLTRSKTVQTCNATDTCTGGKHSAHGAQDPYELGDNCDLNLLRIPLWHLVLLALLHQDSVHNGNRSKCTITPTNQEHRPLQQLPLVTHHTGGSTQLTWESIPFARRSEVAAAYDVAGSTIKRAMIEMCMMEGIGMCGEPTMLFRCSSVEPL